MTTTFTKILVAGAASLILSGNMALAGGHSKPIQTHETSLGNVLTNAEGMTLYTFDNDQKGISNCYEQCATNWPPAIAKDGAKAAGELTLIKRRDGSFMWAHKGMPLYTWIGDSEKGDVTGDGVGSVWHVAKP